MMSPTAMILIAVSGVAWAGLDAVRKALAQRIPAIPLVAALTAAQIPLFAGWVLLSGAHAIPAGYWLFGGISLILNLASLSMFTHSLAIAPISLVIPLLAFVPVFTTLAGIPLLGELPSVLQGLGICVVVVGAVSMGGMDARGEPGHRRNLFRGQLLMIGVSVLWAITGPVDKLAILQVAAELHALLISGGIALLIGVYLTLRRQMATVGVAFANWRLLVLAALFGAVALGSQLLAFQYTLVSLVETCKRAAGMFGAVLSGRLFFGEVVRMRQLICVALMSVGVALLLL